MAALIDMDLEVSAGQLQVIAGPSGSGKSTLLLCAGGLLRPDSGTVSIQGTDLYALNDERRSQYRARKIGFVFQQFHLIPFLSVFDNILAGSLSGERSINELRKRAAELIERLGLSERSQHPAVELSSGERQRAALARALLFEPSLLLADEPTGNLDSENTKTVMSTLNEFAAQGGAVLLVTHNQQLENEGTKYLVSGQFTGTE